LVKPDRPDEPNKQNKPALLSAAALLDGHFEHPELLWQQRHSVRLQRYFMYKPSFSAAC
jgi:hypothetical protein